MKSINKNIYFFISITALVIFFSSCEQKKIISKNSVDKPDSNIHTLKAPEGMVGILPPAEGIIGRGTDYEMPDPNKYLWYGGVFIESRGNVKLSPYAVAKYEVTYKLWKEVYDWAIKNGYVFANSGQKGGVFNKPYDAGKHNNDEPVTMVSWYDCIVWCNAYTHKKTAAIVSVFTGKVNTIKKF